MRVLLNLIREHTRNRVWRGPAPLPNPAFLFPRACRHFHFFVCRHPARWFGAPFLGRLGSAAGLILILTAAGLRICARADPAPSSKTGSPASVPPGDPEVWWAFRPLQRPPVPDVRTWPGAIQNPIDAFVAAKLAEKGLRPAPPADRRTLIRRLFFDLIGLPPTPQEIQEFIADTDPFAYEKEVDRLLVSPRYGERWARHWLDIVHYGETHGYDKDKPRPYAWPYRDYVIRVLNADKPYGRFVQEQIAGDILFPFTRDGIEALGFLAAGPWDFIGHEEVPETKIDGKIARHLDRDDMVMNTFQTFNSLTVQCAQCHDHKFDPVPQEDYYRLQAVFAAIDRTNKKYDLDPTVAKRRLHLEQEQKSLTEQIRAVQEKIETRAGEPLAVLNKNIAAGDRKAPQREAFGYHSAIEPQPLAAKWVQVDLGRSFLITNITLHPCKDDFNQIGEGFGFPVRFKVEICANPDFNEKVLLVADRTQSDVPNPKLKPHDFPVDAQPTRFIRITATQLAPRQNDFIFALAELTARDESGQNVALGALVTALDSIEAPIRWRKANLTDGWYPGAPALEPPQLAALKQERAALIAAHTLLTEKEQWLKLEQSLVHSKSESDKLPLQQTVYAGAVHFGSGPFAGTGPNGGKPRPIHILNRGNVQNSGPEVNPGALTCIQGLPSRFHLPPDHHEGERRAALARWLTDSRNPLTWRSIVNRVWQYHFGRGLVDTPNDFGRMGALPTHPELLDWLAIEFRDGGQSLKQLHRLILTSATYRQTSNPDSQKLDPQKPASADMPSQAAHTSAAAVDADNRLLWRMNRRKLDAEVIRDSILFLSGRLNLALGGPSFQDFIIDKPEHSPHYEYHLHDPDDPKTHRRSIYRFIVRSQPQPFMTTFDCADPSMQVAKRNESLSPLQALALLNNDLVVAMAKHFAAQIGAQGGAQPRCIEHAYVAVTGRPPSPQELDALLAYARQFGLPNLCRLIFNLNALMFVD